MTTKLVSITLIFSILITLFRFTVPLAWYLTNYNYINAELCVNRHIPGSDCNGTCQLKKKVHEQQEHDGAEMPKALERAPVVILFFTETTSFSRTSTGDYRQFTAFQSQAVSLFFLEPSTPPPQIG